MFEDKYVNKSIVFFEKSANYFSDPKVPVRVKSLIKDVKLIALTIDPADRAYSWYQVDLETLLIDLNSTSLIVILNTKAYEKSW